MSQRRACRLADIARSSARYEAQPDREGPLIEDLRRLRDKYPRFGVRRVHALLNRGAAEDEKGDHASINHKRVQRLWHKHGLQVPQRPKKRKVKTGESVPCQAERPDHVWTYDFQEDALASGGKIRLLNILDEFTREWLSVNVGVSLTSRAVIAALARLFAERSIPGFVRSDNGPEFIAAEIKAWLQESGSAPYYIDPGCPWQNGFVESFHGKLRDEFLSREVFVSVQEAQVRAQMHRVWYNEERPHSSLKYLSPAAFARAWHLEQQKPQEEQKHQERQQEPEANKPPE